MKCFIDHKSKSIHSQQLAGDSCGFVFTPSVYREFTNSPVYIKKLLEEKDYKKCTHCVSAPTRFNGKSYTQI